MLLVLTVACIAKGEMRLVQPSFGTYVRSALHGKNIFVSSRQRNETCGVVRDGTEAKSEASNHTTSDYRDEFVFVQETLLELQRLRFQESTEAGDREQGGEVAR
jgi:hypothetical protein